MSKNKQQVIDELVLSKKALLKGLSKQETQVLDTYFEDLLEEFSPILEIFDKINTDERVLKSITSGIKQYIQEENLLEKMSDVLNRQEDIQKAIKEMD